MVGLVDVASRLIGSPPAVGPERRSGPLVDLLSGRWWNGYKSSSTSVSYDSAQAHGAVYACVDLLVRLVAWQMPASVSGRVGPLPMVVANPHPEPQMSGQHWRAQVLESAALRGYAAGLVTSVESSGWPRQILPLHPDLVTWWDDRGRWRWYADGKDVTPWQEGGTLWVAPSPRATPGQPVGRSVLAHAAQQIQLGLGARKFGADFFDSGGMPVAHGKVLNAEEITEPQAEELKRRLLAVTRNREPLISGSNFELTTIPINAEESQFLETIQANTAMVCMYFGIPPESVGGTSGASMTYDNVGAMNVRLLTNTVGSWMNWYEWIYTSMLPRPQNVDLDPSALLRTSTATLYDTAQSGLGAGGSPAVLTQNEAREMVGKGPLPDGDVLYVPSTYVPADLADQTTQIAEPV
jgi:HK97 family phage portal protein